MKCLIFTIFGFMSQIGCSDLGPLGPNDTKIEGVIKILDEGADPVPEASVKLMFETTLKQEYKEGMGPSIIKNFETKQDGKITVNVNAARAGAFVSKDEYWQSAAGISIYAVDELRKSKNRSDPEYWTLVWNPTIILIKKLNPRPMFGDRFYKTFPELNVTYAFDFSENDWVRPHGKGRHKDMFVTFEGKAEKSLGPPRSWAPPKTIFEYDVSVTLHFPNEGDGLLPVNESEHPQSQVLLAREAPGEGYQDRLTLRAKDDELYMPKELAGYWFRVRSSKDPETGEIRSHYGKIKGDFVFQMNGSPQPPGYAGSLEFHYLFSPDTQRSMEYNGENLLPDGHWNPRGPGRR